MGASAVLLAVSAGAGIVEGIQQEQAQEEAQEAQEQALRQQETREKTAAAQQQIQRDNQLQQIQAQQKAVAVAHGMDLSSGTFNALSTASYNNFARATNVGNLNLQIDENDINQRIAASRQQLHNQQWGDFFGTIGNVANIALSGSSLMKANKASTQDFTNKMQSDLNQDSTEINKTYSSLDDPGWKYSDWLKSSNQLY